MIPDSWFSFWSFGGLVDPVYLLFLAGACVFGLVSWAWSKWRS